MLIWDTTPIIVLADEISVKVRQIDAAIDVRVCELTLLNNMGITNRENK